MMMQKKKFISLFSLALVVVLGLNLTPYKTTGAHPGSTGAPSDQTCAQSGCHSDAQVFPNAVNNTTLTFSASDTTYIPGQTYTLTLMAKGSGSIPTTKFGFELVALSDKDSLNAGQFTITETLRTQLVNYFQGMNTRTSVTHQATGTPALSLNYTQWTFAWTAPFLNAGPVTFYFAANVTNDNGTETGDRIYLSSLKVKSPLTTSIKDLAAEYNLAGFYEEENKSLRIRFDLKGKREVQILVFDGSGKQIYESAYDKLSDKQEYLIPLGENFSSGAYLVQLSIDEQRVSKKIIVP
jgi:hypothetical protein